MTSIGQRIAGLESRGIFLFLVDGEIRFRAPKGALTDGDKEALRGSRADIVAYLNARGAAKALRTVSGISGPLTSSVAQEMWRQFAGGAQEGRPFALNIPMVGKFRSPAQSVAAAIQAVIARYDALRVRFQAQSEGLAAFLNPADSFVIEQEDLRGLDPEAANAAAAQGATRFCGQLNQIEGQWLTRAKLFALPNGETLAAISSAHMIADAGTRNIILEEIHDLLEQGAPRAAPSVLYNDYALAERAFLESPQGEQLIAYWRNWYQGQPTMKAPSDGAPLRWGNGVRVVRNFTIPGRVADKVRHLAGAWKVTPFLVYLTIFSIALARWSGMERFPVRVLGDKRNTPELANTVGLMFCADALEIHAPARADFETIMRGILSAYDAALSLRLPTLHFWAPHCVRPGIEAPDYPNRIPAVFNYYSVGTAREKAQNRAGPDTAAAMPWPPEVETVAQDWPRRSSPLFLHVMDMGHDVTVSLHFYQGVVSPADQGSFTALLFQVFAETVPA